MISRNKTGFMVKSKTGKSLSKKNLTKGKAKKRLRQVEYFKNKK